jgi:hypothetical protein
VRSSASETADPTRRLDPRPYEGLPELPR